jgi:hypothetical protein
MFSVFQQDFVYGPIVSENSRLGMLVASVIGGVSINKRGGEVIC